MRRVYHEQRAAHREALERGTADALERLGALPVVTVPAASIVVAEGGLNYRPVVKSKGIKQEKQARRRAKATAAAGGMAGGEVEPPYHMRVELRPLSGAS